MTPELKGSKVDTVAMASAWATQNCSMKGVKLLKGKIAE